MLLLGGRRQPGHLAAGRARAPRQLLARAGAAAVGEEIGSRLLGLEEDGFDRHLGAEALELQGGGGGAVDFEAQDVSRHRFQRQGERVLGAAGRPGPLGERPPAGVARLVEAVADFPAAPVPAHIEHQALDHLPAGGEDETADGEEDGRMGAVGFPAGDRERRLGGVLDPPFAGGQVGCDAARHFETRGGEDVQVAAGRAGRPQVPERSEIERHLHPARRRYRDRAGVEEAGVGRSGRGW